MVRFASTDVNQAMLLMAAQVGLSYTQQQRQQPRAQAKTEPMAATCHAATCYAATCRAAMAAGGMATLLACSGRLFGTRGQAAS